MSGRDAQATIPDLLTSPSASVMYRAATALSFAGLVLGQQVGTNTAEKHPAMPISVCTAAGSCQKEETSVVLDVRSAPFP